MYLDEGSVFVWYLLSNEEVHKMYGKSIWKFIPKTWRPWWLLVVRSKFSVVFNDITLDCPTPVFVDKTLDIKEWTSDIDNFFDSKIGISFK